MYADSGVTFLPEVRLGRVKADADFGNGLPYGRPVVRGKRALHAATAARTSLLDPVEGDEEGIPLRVDLPSPWCFAEGGPK